MQQETVSDFYSPQFRRLFVFAKPSRTVVTFNLDAGTREGAPELPFSVQPPILYSRCSGIRGAVDRHPVSGCKASAVGSRGQVRDDCVPHHGCHCRGNHRSRPMSPRCFCLTGNRVAHNARHVFSWVGCYFLSSFSWVCSLQRVPL